ncbi:MAG: hypothetical protein P5672_25615, partial [Limnospira sp. PMC 1234.20]|nr:hypothetical protein [Limnospira sp. PMC 1234.20]
LPISQGRFLPGGGKETRFLKETGFLVVGWVKRSDTQQIRVYKLGDRSPFLKVVGWVKRSDTQQIQSNVGLHCIRSNQLIAKE